MMDTIKNIPQKKYTLDDSKFKHMLDKEHEEKKKKKIEEIKGKIKFVLIGDRRNNPFSEMRRN